MIKPSYFIGLDLGQAAEFTALAVLERPAQEWAQPEETVYSIRHLQRFPLGTPYTEIAAEVVKLTATPPLQHCTLVVDATGVGAAVVGLLSQKRPQATLRPVIITAGHDAGLGDDGYWHVPKVDLVSVLQVLLQARRLKVSPVLPQAELLGKEFQNFRIKVTLSATDTEAWREGAHDDLVLAVALACWWASRSVIRPFTVGTSQHRSPIEEAPPGVFLT